ncbi:hypothetical protein [Nocardioides antri]|uniref:Uncharacterized protein n=1 Tax=Nocardioides antri TaxID=2607659 RepID=A0A5B1M129_9ACTN|nr:hypothetical protein [Nocardioides antri]KAA1426464.1 hypothetical protein F0U47_13765 [Nocardioides antri]
MSTTGHHLFSGSLIEDHLIQEFARFERQVTGFDDLGELEEFAEDEDRFARRTTVERCVIHRERADFDVDSHGTVTLTLPLSGNLNLLHTRTDAIRGVGPYVEITEDSFLSPKVEPHMTITKSFDPDTDPQTVRKWAKETVDSIEERLAKIHATVDDYNASKAEQARALIEQRRKELESTARLRDELDGPGI